MAHAGLGDALFDHSDLDGANAAYRKTIELRPKYVSAHYNLALTLTKQGKVDEAITCYRKTIELNPKHTPAYCNLGTALLLQKRLDEAIACFRRTIELDPKSALHHSDLGYALSEHGKFDEAIVYFRKAIELAPKFALAHCNLGNALIGQKKLDEAVTAYRKAVELDPNLPVAHCGLGNALTAAGKRDEGIAAYRQAIRFKAAGTEVRDRVGYSLNQRAWGLATSPDPRLRDGKRAVELAKEAIEIKPMDWMYWNTLGVAHYRAGSWKDAVAALEQSLELHKEGDSSDWFFLAMADWQLGDKQAARKWYDKAVAWMEKHQPENEELRRFRAEAEKLMGVGGVIELAPPPRLKE